MSALTLTAEQTMSSREIAELVESRHDDVKRSIVRLSERGAIALPPMAEVPNTGPGPRTISEYRIGKRDSYVIVAQLSPEFTARLVDRWQELEAQVAGRQIAAPRFDVPTTLSGALRLAADQAEQIEQQAAQIEAQKPAVEFVERYTHAEGNKGFREVVKLLNANERDFAAFLISNNIMYRLNGRLAAHAHHQHAGRFAVRTGIGDNEHAFTQSMFTPKGIEWVAGKWAAYRLQAEAA
jgi:phage antirepressor YoqD-like protein